MVTITPTNITVKEGEYVEFKCSATGLGANDFKYQWYINQHPVSKEGNTSVYIISSVSEEDVGNYTCEVRDHYGNIGQSAVARLFLSTYINFVFVVKLYFVYSTRPGL